MATGTTNCQAAAHYDGGCSVVLHCALVPSLALCPPPIQAHSCNDGSLSIILLPMVPSAAIIDQVHESTCLPLLVCLPALACHVQHPNGSETTTPDTNDQYFSIAVHGEGWWPRFASNKHSGRQAKQRSGFMLSSTDCSQRNYINLCSDPAISGWVGCSQV